MMSHGEKEDQKGAGCVNFFWGGTERQRKEASTYSHSPFLSHFLSFHFFWGAFLFSLPFSKKRVCGGVEVRLKDARGLQSV